MSAIEFTLAHLNADRAQLIELNLEYMRWVFAQMDAQFGVNIEQSLGKSVQDYVVAEVEKLCRSVAPEGVFYLIHSHSQLAGMGGLRRLNSDTAEIKRLYVRPQFRGLGIGQNALLQLLSDAKSFGYTRTCLDTAPFMQGAQRMYESNGFVDCPPYEGVEIHPRFHVSWRFMQRTL